jgi:hypothetical protein
MRSVGMRTFVGLLALSGLVPATAAATPQYRPPSIPSPPTIVVRDNATVVDRRLDVHCSSASDCRIVLELDVVAPGGGSFMYTRSGGDVVLVDGQAVEREGDGYTTVPIYPDAGRAHVRIEATRNVAAHWAETGTLVMVADALWARHMLFAPRSPRVTSGTYVALGMTWEPIDGAVQGSLAVSAEVAGDTSLSIDGQSIDADAQLETGRAIALGPASGEPDEGWIRPGGPVLAMGAYMNGTLGARFGMRVGYEFGITDWMIASGSIETDFQSDAALSLMIEGATPNMLFFFIGGVLSVGGGVGAVLEISDQRARGGVRLSGTVTAAPIGFQTTVDYFPDGDEWELALMGRISL